MPITKQDRDDYEEGKRDRERDVVTQSVIDIFGRHPDTSAYYKGRDGEQLDGDRSK